MLNNIKIFEYELIGSTNAEAKKYAASSESREPVLFVAREQSAGRGRLGRSFLSRGGKGIYMSLLYFTREPICDAINVTTAAAVAVARAIEETVGGEMRIKWVNDIYNSGGKAAGILTETVNAGDANAIIVGIGINTGECDFPDELSNIASSIGEVSEEQRIALIERISEGLLCHAEAPCDLTYMEEYRSRSCVIGCEGDIISAGEILGHGRVLDISDDGGLVFLFDGEGAPRTVRSGEISLRTKVKKI